MSDTSDPLVSLASALEMIWSLPTDLRELRQTETDLLYSANVSLAIESLEPAIRDLSPYTPWIDITVSYSVNSWRGASQLVEQRIKPVFVDERPDTRSLTGSIDIAEELQNIFNRLLRHDLFLDITTFSADIAFLKTLGLLSSLEIGVQLQKEVFLSICEISDRAALYVGTGQLMKALCTQIPRSALTSLSNVHSSLLILLVGDTLGQAVGPNLRVLGRDFWRSEITKRPVSRSAARRVADAIHFRQAQMNWSIEANTPPYLTPFHFEIVQSSFQHDELHRCICEIGDSLSVAYWADRTYETATGLECEIRGAKHVQVLLDSAVINDTQGLEAGRLFKLFKWAYQGQSSDKVGILRQITSLMLTDQADNNYLLLAQKAAEIRNIAVSNYQLYLKRSVEQYFDKRLQVSQYLKQFATEIGNEVQSISDALIENVYKTVGVIIAIVIAGLLDPQYTITVAAIASGLYFLYLLFIRLFWMPLILEKYDTIVNRYKHDVAQLTDILTEEEIQRLEGGTVERVISQFERSYARTRLIYEVGLIIALISFIVLMVLLQNVQ